MKKEVSRSRSRSTIKTRNNRDSGIAILTCMDMMNLSTVSATLHEEEYQRRSARNGEIILHENDTLRTSKLIAA
jgi:hypothetical protein